MERRGIVFSKEDLDSLSYGQRQIFAEGVRVGVKQENERIVKAIQANYMVGQGMKNLLIIIEGNK
jgi:hypothetical protein